MPYLIPMSTNVPPVTLVTCRAVNPHAVIAAAGTGGWRARARPRSHSPGYRAFHLYVFDRAAHCCPLCGQQSKTV